MDRSLIVKPLKPVIGHFYSPAILTGGVNFAYRAGTKEKRDNYNLKKKLPISKYIKY